jgi:hypothetical protein
MSLFDRIAPGEDRLPVHLLTAALNLAEGGVFTPQQALTSLNNYITVDLNATAQAEITQVYQTLAALPDEGEKARYLLILESINIAVEMGLLTNETTYKTKLGIT